MNRDVARFRDCDGWPNGRCRRHATQRRLDAANAQDDESRADIDREVDREITCRDDYPDC